MSDKFRKKYRIASTRLQNWDYGWNAANFVTICTKNRDHYFGEIMDGKMILSKTGVIADVLWFEIKNHADNIELDAFVIMPNHVHGIVSILNPDAVFDADDNDKKTNVDGVNVDNTNVDNTNVETRHALSLQPPPKQQSSPPPKLTIGQKRFQNQGKNTLSSIIGSYKSAVTKHARRLGFDFHWQPRFYDHIIRDEASFQKIREYIINNPALWQEDKYFE